MSLSNVLKDILQILNNLKTDSKNAVEIVDGNLNAILDILYRRNAQVLDDESTSESESDSDFELNPIDDNDAQVREGKKKTKDNPTKSFLEKFSKKIYSNESGKSVFDTWKEISLTDYIYLYRWYKKMSNPLLENDKKMLEKHLLYEEKRDDSFVFPADEKEVVTPQTDDKKMYKEKRDDSFVFPAEEKEMAMQPDDRKKNKNYKRQ